MSMTMLQRPASPTDRSLLSLMRRSSPYSWKAVVSELWSFEYPENSNYCDSSGPGFCDRLPRTNGLGKIRLRQSTARQAIRLRFFLLNRHLQDEASVEIAAEGFAGLAFESATTLHDRILHSVNTKDDPNRIRPRPLSTVSVADRVRVHLPAASWNVVRLTVS